MEELLPKIISMEFKENRVPPPWMEMPKKFFDMQEPPRYREEAVRLIPLRWNEMDPDQREIILGAKMSEVERGFFQLKWSDIVDRWGEEGALRTFLYSLYGDDKNPLYRTEDLTS